MITYVDALLDIKYMIDKITSYFFFFTKLMPTLNSLISKSIAGPNLREQLNITKQNIDVREELSEFFEFYPLFIIY